MAIKNPRSRNGVGAKQFVKNMVRGAPPRMWNRLGGPGVTQPVPPPVSENPPVEPPMNYDVKTVSSPGTNPNNAAETPNFFRRQEAGFAQGYWDGKQVDRPLIYDPTMPNTEGRRGDHSRSKIDTAIARDSTTIANRSGIANMIDWNNTQGRLQTNREYRDTDSGTDSYDRAREINVHQVSGADEKQFGGSKWDTWNEQRKRNKDTRQRNRDTRQRRRKQKRNKGKYCKQEAGFLDPEIESLD